MNKTGNLKLFTLTLVLLLSGKSGIANAQDYNYGIVFGSDSDIQEAEYEIEQLAGRLPQYSSLAGLFKKDNEYRSVILFRSEAEAEKNFNIVQQVYSSRQPYKWDLQDCRDWLQNARTEQQIRYYDCP